jgi:hypothetical protein
MTFRTLTLALAGAALMAGCSINVPHDYDDERVTATSCSVKCPGKGRASASCTDPRIPACACEPAPNASCVEPRSASR